MNKVIFNGRLTKDVEFMETEKTAIAKIHIAIDRYVKDGDNEADFIRITAFGKQAENASKHLKKGDLISMEGSVRTGSYENESGERVYTTDFIADRIEYLIWNREEK